MKTYSKGRFIIKGVLFGLVAGVLFTVAIMLLWNWLMPAIFGLTVITIWQALGLLVLSKILFGGARPHKGGFYESEKSKMHKHNFAERMHAAKEMRKTQFKDQGNEKE